MIRGAALGVLLLAGNLHAELDREQIAALRDRLVQLADAVEAGDTDETRQLSSALQRWARQQDKSLPVDLLCREPDAESLRQLAGNLESLQTLPATEDFAAVRATLEQVLASPEYHRLTRPNWWQKLIAPVLRGIGRLWDLITRIPGAEKVASVMYYIAIAALLVPLALVIGYLIWWQIQQRRSAPRLEATGAIRALESPETYRARAEEFFRQGQYVEALKQFHLAALAALEQRGWVAHDRTRTNWEYLAQLQSRAPAESVSIFRALNLLYDRVVFGAQPCDATLAREFADKSQQLIAHP